MQNKSTFWEDKQVLVTGAGGFIGSHLVEKLANSGAKVRAFVRYNSRGDPGLLSMLPTEIIDKLDIIAGDLRDLPAVLSASSDVQVIFHLGALIAIPYSYKHPAEVVESNVMGTLNVLLAGRENGVARIIHTSSSEVYGSAIRVPIDETHPLQGQSPYSASKIGADKLAESFYCAYDLPVVTIRPFNTYGPRQSARAVIPSIILQAINQYKIHLGNLEAIRDFTYVSDTVEGFLCAAQTTGIEGKTINLGVGSEIRIKELINEIISILGKPIEIVVDEERLRPSKSEVTRLLSDNRLAREILGWTPRVSLREGLSKTIEWISGHTQHYLSKQYQI
ncbi:MAG: SDR family NAD(P)-dependent oxidoreductase [Anaerolineales bacterium]